MSTTSLLTVVLGSLIATSLVSLSLLWVQRLRTRRELDVLMDFTDRSREQSDQVVLDRISAEQRRQTYEIAELLEELRNQRAHGSTDEVAEQVVSEIAHNLMTPLSQLQIRLEKARLTDSQLDLAEAQGVIVLCQEILDSYRRVETISTISSTSSTGIAELAETALRVFAESESKDITWQVDVPSVIDRYGGYYVVSLLVPLLQNAVQAAPQHTKILVEYEELADFIAFTVTNESTGLPDGLIDALNDEDAPQPDYAKERPGRGLGIKSVRRLLSRTSSARLSFDKQGDKFVARVRLPSRPRRDPIG